MYPRIQAANPFIYLPLVILDFDHGKQTIWQELTSTQSWDAHEESEPFIEKSNYFLTKAHKLDAPDHTDGFYFVYAEIHQRYFCKLVHNAAAEHEVSSLKAKLDLFKGHQMRAEVFRSAGGDCTNGGASSVCDSMDYVLENDPKLDDEQFCERDNVLVLVNHHYGWRAVPIGLYFTRQPMFGGNFLHTSDSRFPTPQTAIKIFDRVE